MTENKKVFNNIEYQKEYYKNNKDKLLKKLNEKFTCELCGGSYTYSGKSKHLQTKKHNKFINNDIIQPNKKIDKTEFNKKFIEFCKDNIYLFKEDFQFEIEKDPSILI